MIAWHNVTCAFYEKNGNEYMNITNWVEDYSPDKIIFTFDNLIDGNEELSAQVLQVMNDNNHEVFEALRHDYQKSYGAIYWQIANSVFSKIPWKELFLE